MKVSVVIPAYNEEKTIGETLRLVLAQNYPDFEVIVVDNASNDNTAAVVANFPVRLIHEKRKGILWARECGRNNASGEIVANIDADCLPEPDWLSRGLKYFNSPKVAAVTGPYDYYDAQGSFRHISLIFQKNLYKWISWILQKSKKGAILIGGNNFISKQALAEMNGYNTDLLFYGEDTDTAKRVARHGRIVFDSKLVMKTSARRYQKDGILTLTLRYWKYFFKEIFS